jgi:hypothetical protein
MLIPLFLDLVETEFFITAINYQNNCILEDNNLYFQDLLDGSVAPQHLNSMQSNFEKWKSIDPTSRQEAIPVNLLLNEFYDGGQLFKWRVKDFWGLFTGILNLPPTYRGKVGISTFLSAIYSGKHKKAEKFLFADCYCEELRVLYVGYEHISPISDKIFFIQARLICHTLDSKAQEPVFKLMSMSNARYGCWLCRSITGVHDSYRCQYIGNRHLLDVKNPLRYFGQTGLCCPAKFYDNRETEQHWFNDEKFLSNSKPIKATHLTVNEAKGKQNKMEFCRPCNNDESRMKEIQEFLLDEKEVFPWAHNDVNEFDDFDVKWLFQENDMQDHIFFRHFDFRPQQQHRRITKEEHIKAAKEARELNLNKNNRESTKVHGFYDVWVFDRLPYSDLPQNTTPPIDHAVGGAVHRMCDYMFGVYKEKPATRKKRRRNRIRLTWKQHRNRRLLKRQKNKKKMMKKYMVLIHH